MNYFLISTLLFIALLCSANTVKQKLFYFFFSILFSFIYSFRPSDTPDTTEYIKIFQEIQTDGNWLQVYDRYEVGYCFLNRLVKFIVNSHELFFFMVSFVNYLIFYYVLIEYIKEERNYVIYKRIYYYFAPIFVFYTSYFGLMYNSIVMRGGLGLSFLYLSCMLCYKHKIIPGVMTYLVATTLHQTVLLTFPIPLLFYKRFTLKKHRAVILLAFSFLIYIFNIRALTAVAIPSVADFLYARFPSIHVFWWISQYTDVNMPETGGISVFLLSLFVMLYIYLCNVDESRGLDTFGSVSLIGIIIYSMFGNYSLMIRFADYFLFSLTFALGCLFTLKRNINLNMTTNGSFNLPKPFIIIPISVLFYIVFLRNAIYV